MDIYQVTPANFFLFNGLPIELRVEVFSNLNLQDKKSVRLVSHEQKDIIDQFFIRWNYNWKRELETYPGIQGANPSNFLHVLTPLYKLWLSDLTGVLIDVEYIHPDTKACVYWIAKIIKLHGYFVKLRYLSPSEETDDADTGDFFMHLFDTCIPWNSNPWQCIGSYSRQYQGMLPPVPPPEVLKSFSIFRFSDKEYHWSNHFLNRRIAEAGNLHIPLQRGVQKFLDPDGEYCIKVGDFCEVFDQTNSHQLRVGIISKIVGTRIMVRYMGEYEIEELWCHRFSKKIYPKGWARTVEYDITVPVDFIYDPPSISATEMNAKISLFHGIFESYEGLIIGMNLEIVDPSKPSQLCPATIIRVLKWGYFILKINYSNVDNIGSSLVCRHLTSRDIFPCGFAQENNISFVPPSRYNHSCFNWNTFFEETGTHACPTELLLKDPCSKVDFVNNLLINDKLEAMDWRDGCSLRPATITEVKGKLIKIHYDGFPCDLDKWTHISSLDIYPLGWAQVTKYPLQFPGNFKL